MSTRLVRLASILTMGAALMGCGRSPRSYHFVLVPKSLGNPYWFAAEQGMRKAAEELGVKAEFLGTVRADVADQASLIESLIAKRVDGIAVSPNDPDGLREVIDRAVQAGIPVITFDSDAPNSRRLCYVGTDNYRAGREAGKQMLRFLGTRGKYGIITGGLGALNLNERIRGFRDVLQEANADLQEIAVEACDDDPDIALQKMENVTRARPDLNAWFVTGCWAVVAPKKTFLAALGNRQDVVVIGFDVLKESLLLVKEGAVHALIGQRPFEMGYRSVYILYDIVARGKKPEQTIIDTGVDIVTRENVDAFLTRIGEP
ncbi:MAG: sugar-binding protein [candidate division KSB1 bacterium]|nr:sugar-binding protein [candidate division KSB1 bacterium]